jgi:hypothetical protein
LVGFALSSVLKLRATDAPQQRVLSHVDCMELNFEQVHNYYERLVFEEVARHSEDHPDFTSDMLGDVACVALNRLPARYVRHDVDLMFYLTEQERRTIELSLNEVLQFAFAFVRERSGKVAR